MRHGSLLVLLASCLVQAPSHAAPPDTSCAVEAQTYDSKDVACSIAGSGEARRFDFIARFSGGHDDTRAGLQAATLDGKAIGCDEGSKKDLFAEDGDVSLNCRFTVRAGLAGDSRFRITIRWSHAQYTDFELSAR